MKKISTSSFILLGSKRFHLLQWSFDIVMFSEIENLILDGEVHTLCVYFAIKILDGEVHTLCVYFAIKNQIFNRHSMPRSVRKMP